MEEIGLDAWTRRLSTREQVGAIERTPLPDEVEAFRSEYLPDGKPFEDREAAREWLEKIAAKSGSEVGFWFDDQDKSVVVHASKHRFFQDLEQVAGELAKYVDWMPSSVRAWLITADARPIVFAVDMEMPYHPPNAAPPGGLAGLMDFFNPKVTLKIALDTPPKVVMDYYAMAQRIYEDERGEKLPRKRAMAEWTLELVAFAASRNDGRSWPQLLDDWNSSTPEDWHFESSKQINLATRKGYRTLMGLDLDWRGPSIRPAHPKKGEDE